LLILLPFDLLLLLHSITLFNFQALKIISLR